jgi:phage gpG-like protein
MARERNKETQLTLQIPKDFDPNQRAELADRVLEFIRDRSKKGYNVLGRDWSGEAGKYTEEYAKKKGVSAGGPVDLSLSHDMLDGMQYFPSKSPTGQITIGFRKGTLLERKAEGNIIGSYGKPQGNPKKARPFLDILQKDLKDIIEEVRSDGSE